MEHMVFRFVDIPKRFSLKSSKKSTTAIAGPPIYQGQGAKIKSIVIFAKYNVNLVAAIKIFSWVITKKFPLFFIASAHQLFYKT
jgi:hypothetical protein